MNSLWVKLMGAFVLIILIGTGMVVFLVSQTTSDQFALYTTQAGQQQAVQLAPLAADYYSRSGSWVGIEAALGNPWGYQMSASDMMDGDMMMGNMGRWSGSGMNDSWMMEEMQTALTNRILLAQLDGTVIVDSSAQWIGNQLQPDDLAKGAPIIVGGQQVATLIITPLDTPATPAADFLNTVNRSAVFAGVAAATIALILGSLLFIQITRPLRRLSAAAQGIAAGDLSQRVSVGSRDEIGRVALTFNRMAETLQHYEGERRNMMGDIAHDLRTPLSIIQSNLEAMLDGLLPTTQEELTSLHQETLLLNRLVTDLHTLSLAEAGQLKLQKRLIEAGKLVEQVAEGMRLRAEEKHIALQSNIAAELQPFQADPERLVQVLTNLVDNAIRYNGDGTRVLISAQSSDGCIELSVSDNGSGIPPEDIPHLFERFWRAEKSRNRATGGAGLGLAIVKQLVEAHQGHVRVESQMGNGTNFTVYLPVF